MIPVRSDQQTLSTLYGAYFAVLPALPSVQVSQLLDVCHRLPEINIQWLYHRTSELEHPHLSDPLKFLEISGRVSSESICQMILNALNRQSIVGNAELILLLPNTPIPILDSALPYDGSTNSFVQHGVVALRGGVDVTTPAFDEVFQYIIETFDQLYSHLQTKESRHFKEIMQRDPCRFDIRLDMANHASATKEMNSPIDRLEQSSSWLRLIRELLGDDYVRIKTGYIVSLPGAGEQYWHSDGVHVGAVGSFSNLETCADSHAVCVFVPLIELTSQTGYTEFWSGSHKFDSLLSKKGEQSLPGGTLGILKKGDCLLYDYRTIHRGMPNRSTIARPICYYLYARRGFETVEDQNFADVSLWQ